MDDKPESNVRYTVTQAASGQWAVQQSGFREPLATFRDRNDAVEYAERLAGTKVSADVTVDGEGRGDAPPA